MNPSGVGDKKPSTFMGFAMFFTTVLLERTTRSVENLFAFTLHLLSQATALLEDDLCGYLTVLGLCDNWFVRH